MHLLLSGATHSALCVCSHVVMLVNECQSILILKTYAISDSQFLTAVVCVVNSDKEVSDVYYNS